METPKEWIGDASPPMKIVTEDKPLPEPGKGEVLLKHIVGGLAWADTMIAGGSIRGLKDGERRVLERELNAQSLPHSLLGLPVLSKEMKYMDVKKSEYPLVLGYDTIAKVLKAGPGVPAEIKEGATVAALTVYGSNQTYSIRKANDLVLVPEGLDPAKGVSCILNYVTAWQMLKRTACSRISPTTTDLFVVHAASGGVGTALLDIIRCEYPGAKVLGTCGKAKMDLVSAYGAEPFDYNSGDFAAKIKEMAPKGALAIFDAVGSDNQIKSYSCLSPEGTLVIYGFTRDVASGGSLGLAIAKLASRVLIPAKIAGVFGAKYAADFYVITQYKDKSLDNFKEDLGQILKLTKEGKLNPEVQAVVPIEEGVAVYEFFRKGNSRGKLILVMDEEYKGQLEKEGRLGKGSELK